MKYQMTLTEEQLWTIRNSMEILARLHMGQFSVLRELNDTIKLDWDDCQTIKRMAQPETPVNQYHGIRSEKLPESAHIAYDIYQAVRFFLAWKDEQNTPETRGWSRQIGVTYDEPLKISNEPLPEIRKMPDDHHRHWLEK